MDVDVTVAGLVLSAGTIAGTHTGTVDNSGIFKKSGGSGGSAMQWIFSNSGFLSPEMGTLRFQGGYTQTAGSTVLAGGTIQGSNPLNLQGGTLLGTGTVVGGVSNSGGTVAPGASAGILLVTGAYGQSAGGALAIEIGGLVGGAEYDQLAVGDAASLAGTLDVDLIDSFVPVEGQEFAILTYGSRAGEFGTFEGQHIEAGLYFKAVYGPTDLTLEVSQAHEGDATFDECVDVFDLAALANQYGIPGDWDWPDGDFTGDSEVNVFDLAVLANNYGWCGARGESIPEPLAAVLLGLGGAALLRRRRRRVWTVPRVR